MTELEIVDNQLRQYMFGNTFSLLIIDMCRYDKVFYMFRHFTVITGPENMYQYENIQQFVSLLWTHFPNLEDRINAFYKYRETYKLTYKYLTRVSFGVISDFYSFGSSYHYIVESLILCCLID